MPTFHRLCQKCASELAECSEQSDAFSSAFFLALRLHRRAGLNSTHILLGCIPVSMRFASQTTPIPPSPRRRIGRYGPNSSIGGRVGVSLSTASSSRATAGTPRSKTESSAMSAWSISTTVSRISLSAPLCSSSSFRSSGPTAKAVSNNTWTFCQRVSSIIWIWM